VVKKRDDSSPFTCARLDSGYWVVLVKESISGGHHPAEGTIFKSCGFRNFCTSNFAELTKCTR
jgi:hypothetical protein